MFDSLNLEYESLKWLSSPKRNPEGAVAILFDDDGSSIEFGKNLHAKGFLLNWISPDREIKKYLLSEEVYDAVDSNEALRAYFFRKNRHTPEQMGVLLMPKGGQYLYQVAAVPDKPGWKYIIVLWLQGANFNAMEVGFIAPEGLRLHSEACMYALPTEVTDPGMCLSYVLIFLAFEKEELLKRSNAYILGYPVEHIELTKDFF